MNTLGIEIHAKKDLLPVTIEELMASTFSLLATLRILMESSLGNCECSVSCGEISWSGSSEEIEMVENSTPWSYLKPMWLYAEKGELISYPNREHIDDVSGDLVKWLCAIHPISDYSGENAHTPILKVIIKFFARLKLDFNIDISEGGRVPFYGDLEGGCVTIASGWLPQVDFKHLTIVELALLAGVSNIRTVRNAQYDKERPLSFFKKGKTVLVTVEVAKEWLSKRRGFVASKAVLSHSNYGD